jgi:hypothetical protein
MRKIIVSVPDEWNMINTLERIKDALPSGVVVEVES